MKVIVYIAVLLLLGILASGCVQQPATPAPLKNQTVEQQIRETIPPTATPIAGTIISTLSDRHSNVTLSLDPGVMVVFIKAEDALYLMRVEMFSLGTVIPNNYATATDFETTGPFNGSIALQIPKKGEYQLNITSWVLPSGGGTWNAQVSRLNVERPLNVPVNLSGAGTVVTPVFYLEKGQYIFSRNKTKVDSPWFYLQYTNGSPLMDPNNTFVQPGFGVDSPETFRFVSIPESGTYFINVISEKSPNDWSASIIPAPTIPLPLGPVRFIPQPSGNGTP